MPGVSKAVALSAGALLLVVLIGAAVAIVSIVSRGISTRSQPTAVEAALSRALRHLAIPGRARQAVNPVQLDDDVLGRARAHFADHCASCHGNDGRGRTTIGQNLYPKAPDMTKPQTQRLSDGELFSIIKNGVRLTGMPAWGADDPGDDRETWELVHLIRHFPTMSADEMQSMKELNPRSREEWEQERAEKEFLEGGGAAPTPPPGHHPAH